MSRDPAADVLTPLVIGVIVMASWALRPEGRVLGELVGAKAPDSVPRGAVAARAPA
jgi:hypothetical protein